MPLYIAQSGHLDRSWWSHTSASSLSKPTRTTSALSTTASERHNLATETGQQAALTTGDIHSHGFETIHQFCFPSALQHVAKYSRFPRLCSPRADDKHSKETAATRSPLPCSSSLPNWSQTGPWTSHNCSPVKTTSG